MSLWDDELAGAYDDKSFTRL